MGGKYKGEVTRKVSASYRLLKEICEKSGGAGSDNTVVLQEILDELKTDNQVVENQVTDANNVVHIRRTVADGDGGVITTTYLNPETGATTTPIFPLKSRVRISLPIQRYKTVTLSATANGTIPTDSVSYLVTNLGSDSFIFNGLVIPAEIKTLSGNVSAIESGYFGSMAYQPNGNTLFITYTIKD